MPDVEIPTYVDLLYPVLQALSDLGGSATKEELDEAAVSVMDLSQAQLDVEFPPDAHKQGSKVADRLAWTRTYLKKFGAVDNSRRGVWTLESPGRGYLAMGPVEGAAALRQADTAVRREARLARNSESRGARIYGGDGIGGADSEAELLTSSSDEGDWKDDLLTRLLDLRPDAFERLAQRLLREAGFKNVEVLGRSGDGGLDGVGVYRPSLISFPIFFQCKRYRDSVGPGPVRDFRGAMAGRGEKGLLITTGTFTTEAKREAVRDGAPPVELIDGSDLCDLLKEYNVGVATRLAEGIKIQASFFDTL